MGLRERPSAMFFTGIIICALAVAGSPSAARAVCPDFAPVVSYPAGSKAIAITSADFNRDGAKDVATANYYGDNVSVLLGMGNGTFLPAMNSAAGHCPRDLTVGDFDRDGKSDLAVANNCSGNISVLLGRGDGTFDPPVNYPSGSNPNSIAAADFNGDGNTDLAVANRSSGTVAVFIGAGDGSFASAVTYAGEEVFYSCVERRRVAQSGSAGGQDAGRPAGWSSHLVVLNQAVVVRMVLASGRSGIRDTGMTGTRLQKVPDVGESEPAGVVLTPDPVRVSVRVLSDTQRQQPDVACC